MIFDRNQKCPNCGTENPPNANFCKICNTPVGKGTKNVVPVVKSILPMLFVPVMWTSDGESEAPKIINNQWRTSEEFAVRVETDDLPGLLERYHRWANTNACFSRTVLMWVLCRLALTLDSFSQRFGNLFHGLPKTLTALLVKITPTDLNFPLERLFAKIRCGLICWSNFRLKFRTRNSGQHAAWTRAHGETLREHLQPEVLAVAEIGTFTLPTC